MKASSFLSRFRFTLAEILGVSTLFAVCVGAMVNESPLAELPIRYLMICLVSIAAVTSALKGPAQRPFCSGFAICTMLFWFIDVDAVNRESGAMLITGWWVVPGDTVRVGTVQILHTAMSLGVGILAGWLARSLSPAK